MKEQHQDIINLIAPFLASPGLIFGGCHYASRVIAPQAIVDALDRNPDLDLSAVKIGEKWLVEEFMNGVGRLRNWDTGSIKGVSAEISRIGTALIKQHGCNPWEPGIASVMTMLNAITVMHEAPLAFVKAVMEHPAAPPPAEIEIAAAGFAQGHHTGREQGPVHHACNENRADLIAFWLGLGFGVEARSSNGNLPIALATSAEVAGVLLDAGSPITRVDSDGQGAMDAWSGTVSASVKEMMGKEVSRAIDEGRVRVDRDLLLEMARNGTARRKIDDMMKSSGIGWWDAHEDGSIAQLAIIDMLARYNNEPKFVQGRMTSLISSAHDWAKREGVKLDDFDQALLWVVGCALNMDKIRAKQPEEGSGLLGQIFSRVLDRLPGDQGDVIDHAYKWHEMGLMEDANAVQVLTAMASGYQVKLKKRMSYSMPLGTDIPCDWNGCGMFVHKQLPEMIKRLSAAEQAKAVPAMAILSNDLLAREQERKPGGGLRVIRSPETVVSGGIQEALMGMMDITGIGRHIDGQAMTKAIEFIQAHAKVYSRAGEGLHAFLAAQAMAANVDDSVTDAPATKGPRF